MTAAAAYHKFMTDFGLTAYPRTAVPEDAVYPYLVYDWTTADFDEPVPVTMEMFFYTESEAEPNRAASQFRKYVEQNGYVEYGDGAIWVTAGNPYCQALTDAGDYNVKRRLINLNLEFIGGY